MAKPTLSSYIRENLDNMEGKKDPGPFITISRQFGCDGYKLGEILLEKLEGRPDEEGWRLYKKEILKQLAQDSGLTEEVIEKERKAKPSLLKDFFRGVRRKNLPGGYEIRNKITLMVRTVAFEGHAIIIGQGGTAATADLDGGISVRIEAPKDWRIIRVSRRDNMLKEEASAKLKKIEKERAHLRDIYEEKNPRKPAFNLIIDNSRFTLDEAADLIIYAMEQKGLLKAP
ncbi:MAG: cytidylate kinase-like family protein [Planctomycetes bacterium]|nr:cytidylate kinase-like family protein [Planctomycetota bacterium]